MRNIGGEIMKIEELTSEEKVEIFHRLEERHREETHELRQIIEEQRQTIENLSRVIEDRKEAYEMLYKRYLNLKYPKNEG